MLAGTQSRYLADDYCYDAQFIKRGFWAGQIDSYLNPMPYSSNRYSLTLFSGLLWVLGGVQFMPFLPAVAAVLWGFALIYTIQQGSRKLQFALPGPAVMLIAASILFYTLLLAPNRYQILFWRSGLLPYLAPLLLNTWLLGRFFAIQHKPTFRWWNGVEVGFTAWLAAGFSETVFAIQFVFWGMILLLTLWRRQSLARRLVILILIGSLMGAALLLLNPTNAARQSPFPPPPPLWQVGLTATRYSFDFFEDYVSGAWLPLMVFMSAGFLIGWLELPRLSFSWRQFFVRVGGLLLATMILLISLMAPTIWSMSSYPELRGLLAGAYIMNLFLFGVGVGMGVAARKVGGKYLTARVSLLISLVLGLGFSAYTLHFIPDVYGLMPVYQQRAEIWDQRHADILHRRDAGQTQMLVPGIDSIAKIFELQPKEGHWVNRCAAEYYGLESIWTTE